MNMIFRKYILQLLPVATVLAVLVLPAIAEPFPPIDEGAKDPRFTAFRDDLLDVVDRRDPANLKKYLHPDAIESFGGNLGRDAFLKAMKVEPQRWAILSDILRKGGRFRMEDNGSGRKVRTFYAPYTFFAEIPDSEAMAIAVLTGNDMPVHAAPGTGAKVIRRFSDEALEVVICDKADNETWYEVKLPDGGSGFVAAKHAVLNTDYRAGFVRHEGRWKMRSFVAGD